MDSPMKFTPHYEQPVSNFIKRSLKGSQEYVDFIPKSHLRIWYNHQTEGYANHYHNALEIIICVENQYVIIANNQTYLLNPGDILIIPPFMLHELRGNTLGSRFIFLIDIDMLRCFQDFKTLDPIFMSPFLCTASSHSEIYQYIYDSLMKMADIYFSHGVFWETSIYIILLNILMNIGRHHYNQLRSENISPTDSRQHEYYTIFANLLNYIDAHYTENLTLEQVADYIGFSKYHFSRLFKQHAHMTFHNYLCHKRIQAAQSLLTANMTLPITDIAFQTGFNNLTSFSRCFNKYANCSPTEYRNKLLSEEISY